MEDLKKKSMKQLLALERKRRPDVISGGFLLLALGAGSLLSEMINIVHDYARESEKYDYSSYVGSVFFLGIVAIVTLFFLVRMISLKPFDEVYNEIERRIKLKKNKP